MKKLFTLFLIILLSSTFTFAQGTGYRYNSNNKRQSKAYGVTANASNANRSLSTTQTKVAVPLQKVRYYTNSEGYKVQSPTRYSSVPAGATAICRDGTYSFSRNRRGTCSCHGGVAKWLK